MVNTDWLDAGLTDDKGELGKPLPHGSLFVPGRIELDVPNHLLRWDIAPSKDESLRIIKPSKQILSRFASLWSDEPEATLRFAQTYGVLGMDEKGNLGTNGVTGSEP